MIESIRRLYSSASAARTHAAGEYQEPRFPPPGSKTARLFNFMHKTAVLGLVGSTLFLGTYVVSAVKHKYQHKKEQRERAKAVEQESQR